MTARQIQEATDKARLITACDNLALAMQAKEAEYIDPILEHKGKTLYHINRERAKTVKMTVNY